MRPFVFDFVHVFSMRSDAVCPIANGKRKNAQLLCCMGAQKYCKDWKKCNRQTRKVTTAKFMQRIRLLNIAVSTRTTCSKRNVNVKKYKWEMAYNKNSENVKRDLGL